MKKEGLKLAFAIVLVALSIVGFCLHSINAESDGKVLYLNRSYHAEIKMPSGNVVTGQSYIKREYTDGSVLISINGVEYRTSWANVVIFKNCN